MKKALILALFCAILLPSAGNSALGEEGIVAENQIVVEPEYEVVPVEQIPAEELEPVSGSMNEKVLSADAKIIWQKNSVYFGNFIPNKVYILEDSGDKLAVESVLEITDEGGDEYNVFAFGVDQNEDNSYAFRLKAKRGGKNFEPEFLEFISNFEK